MRRSFFDERGESLIQFVVGSLVGAFLLSYAASAVASTMQIGQAQTTRQTSELASDIFAQRVGPEGDSATAVFIPLHDIFGAANSVVNTPTTGSVVGEPANGAHEVDFMQRGLGVLGLSGLFDKWWCYYYDSANHTLVKYTYTTRSGAGLASGVSAAGATISNVRSFNASYLPASQLNQVEHYINASGAAPPDVLIQTGYPEVYEGNRGVVVWIDSTSLKSATSNPKLRHYVYLQPASAPQAPIVNYTWSPPPAQALIATPDITFASNGSGGWLAGNPTSTISVYEMYYHRGFTNGGCVSGGTTVATLSGPSPQIKGYDNVANNPPTSFPGEWEQYTVTPVAAGQCTVTFASSTANPDPDNKTASVTITVASPSVSFNTWPAQLTLGAGGSSIGTSSGAVAYVGSEGERRVAQLLNAALGGSTARAAGGQPCFALAETSGASPDTSFMKYAAFAGGLLVPGLEGSGTSRVTVDTNGCEVWADTSLPLTAAQAGAIAYNTVNSSVLYQYQSQCGSIATLGSWTPSSNGVVAMLGATGQASGSCNLIASVVGQSPQTPSADSGLVAVTVENFANETFTKRCHGINIGVDWDSPCNETLDVTLRTNCTVHWAWNYIVQGADQNGAGRNDHSAVATPGSDYPTILENTASAYFDWLTANGWIDQTNDNGPDFSAPDTLVTSGC